jgi:hypothetical protein
VNKPKNKQSCLGVILDATGAYKTFDSTDYVTKLKVIDPSFNFETSKSSLKRYIHVFIYTPTVGEAPVVNRIGDIIRLKNFDVSGSNLYFPAEKFSKEFVLIF